MKTILFKTIIIAFFVGTAVSCSDEDENRFRPGSTHEKPNPTEPEGGLDQQEYHQYMTWSGRSVSHLILRCFLLGDKIIFNFFNSFVFVGLTLLIYLNIERRKKNDVSVYLLINLSIYTFYGMYESSWNLIFADVVLISIPVLILYIIFNKRIEAGMVSGAVKG